MLNERNLHSKFVTFERECYKKKERKKDSVVVPII